MANPYHHAVSSARKYGGAPEDYQAIHDWFDASKEHVADFRHRALRHHTQGIFEAERVFGHTITNGDGRPIPVRWIGEQHVRADLGRIPFGSRLAARDHTPAMDDPGCRAACAPARRHSAVTQAASHTGRA